MVFTPPHPLLTLAEQYFQEKVQPQAAAIDQDSEALLRALKGMGDRRLLALRVPQQWGGSGMDDLTYCHFQRLIACYSGGLAFLQAQHQSAAYQLAQSPHEGLKQAYLPFMAAGEVLMGVGYSHLRRQDHSPLKAISTSQGYQLNGMIPWITGWNFFQWVIVGGVLPSQEALYAIIPFRTTQQSSGGKIHFSAPMSLATMQPSNTVSAMLENWVLKPEEVVSIKPIASLTQQDRKNVLHHGFYAIGCAQASLEILHNISQRQEQSFIRDIHTTLLEEVEHCCHQMLEASSDDETPYEKRLNLRTWSISLAGRCSQSAVIASSGAANSLNHPAQRVYREALMFSVFGQTTDVMENTLRHLL